MVRFWHKQLDMVVTRFLDAPIVNIATAETLFRVMSEKKISNGLMSLDLPLIVLMLWLAEETVC